MRVFKFNWRYSSGVGSWEKGAEHPFDDELAAHILRDSPGCMDEVKAPEPEPEPETRAKDKPPSDRQVKSPTSKRGA